MGEIGDRMSAAPLEKTGELVDGAICGLIKDCGENAENPSGDMAC